VPPRARGPKYTCSFAVSIQISNDLRLTNFELSSFKRSLDFSSATPTSDPQKLFSSSNEPGSTKKPCPLLVSLGFNTMPKCPLQTRFATVDFELSPRGSRKSCSSQWEGQLVRRRVRSSSHH